MSEWIDVNDQLPNSNRRVIFTWINELNKQRKSMGFYAKKHTISADSWDEVDLADYCEEKDKFFCPEGWHEEMWEAEFFYSVPHKVTHWMPQPEGPK